MASISRWRHGHRHEITHAGLIEGLLHFKLLQLITGVDDHPARGIVGQYRLDELLAE